MQYRHTMKTSALFFLLLCVMTARAFSNQASSVPAAPTTPPTTTTTMDAATQQVEAVVRRYFAGVHNKDAAQIRSCFGTTATIRDVCSRLDDHYNNNNNNNTVAADVLVQRCMDFVTAHPDCAIDFYYGPTCEHRTSATTTNDNDNDNEDDDYYWVWAHWYERGTWSGESCGLTPTHAPMACEGQTRFRVHATQLKIVELVVTRTFTEWETALLVQQQQQQTNINKQGQEESSSSSL